MILHANSPRMLGKHRANPTSDELKWNQTCRALIGKIQSTDCCNKLISLFTGDRSFIIIYINVFLSRFMYHYRPEVTFKGDLIQEKTVLASLG